MSGTNPGTRWGHRRLASYIIRVRDRHLRVRGQRRVASWAKWRSFQYSPHASTAFTMFEELRHRRPTSDVAVFFKGRRLTDDQLRAAVTAERERHERAAAEAIGDESAPSGVQCTVCKNTGKMLIANGRWWPCECPAGVDVDKPEGWDVTGQTNEERNQ